MNTISIATTTHGRVLVAPPDRGPAAGLIVGCHGYAESAAHHLAELQRLPGSGHWLLVSVQALHRFYRGRTEEVVASWMTRQDRDEMIADNVAYVAAVLDRVRTGPLRDRPLIYSGFSQGASMAWRAALRSGAPADAVLALGGDIPHDVQDDWTPAPRHALIGRGRAEPWYTSKKFEQDCAFVGRTPTILTRCEFDGGHEWTDTFRDAAGALLERLTGS